MRTSIASFVALTAVLLLASAPDSASASTPNPGPAPSLSSVIFEDGRSIRWYELDPVHCGSFGPDVRRCQGIHIDRVITFVPVEIAVQDGDWFGPDTGSILDIVPENTALRVVAYNPATGALLSHTSEVKGPQRTAHLERQLDILRDMDLVHGQPLDANTLLDALGDTLTQFRPDSHTAVLLVAPNLFAKPHLFNSRRGLERLPAAHYTVFDNTTFHISDALQRRIPATDLGSTFLVQGPVKSAHDVQELIFNRLEVEFAPGKAHHRATGEAPYVYISKDHHRKKRKRRCRRGHRGKHRRHWGKRVFLIFWYSLGFFALVYLLSRRRRRDTDEE